MKRTGTLAAILLAAAIGTTAAHAEDDCGLLLDASATYKINKKWSVGAEAEMRTRNSFRTMDRWAFGVDGAYKPLKFLKVSAGYTLLYDNNPEKINRYDTGEPKNWRPSYWGLRHRFNVSLTGSVDFSRFTVSLRERWQYTYRPEKTVERYDFESESWETRTRGASSKNVLRSRLQVEYNIPKCKVDPYANVEIYNSWKLEKTRITAGFDWKINKKNSLEAFYRYQLVSKNDPDPDKDMHMVGVEYNFKF